MNLESWPVPPPVVLVSLKEMSRLAGQIRRLYGSNKKTARPFWICLTGFATDSPLYEECLRMNDGFSGYLVCPTAYYFNHECLKIVL